MQERYGRYDLSDPFMALQRDDEAMQGHGQDQPQARGHGGRGQVNPSPLAVLKLVMSHCKRMQEKMMAQLAAAESRHRRVRDCACVRANQVKVIFCCIIYCIFQNTSDVSALAEL